MKSLRNVWALLALVFAVSCELPEQQEQEQPEPVQPAAPMEFNITSANPMVVLAEGGDYAISYSITSPDENLEVYASTEVDWIRIKGDEGDNKVHFAVAANELEQSRSTVIVVTYDRDYKIVVNQAGANRGPQEILSNLTHDVDMVMTGDDLSTYAFADYWGGTYGDGRGMWQFWFVDVVNRQMICLEILTDSQGTVPTDELYIPTGQFITTNDVYTYDVLVPGYRTTDIDGLYDGGSWFTQLETDVQEEAYAPIDEGELNVSYDSRNESYYITFDLMDDAGNKITGVYTGSITIEDFR